MGPLLRNHSSTLTRATRPLMLTSIALRRRSIGPFETCGPGRGRVGRADHVEAGGYGPIGAPLVLAGVVRREDQQIPRPRFARTLQTLPEKFRPGVGTACQVRPADRLYEQEIAGKGKAVVREQRDAAEGVARHVYRSQCGAAERDGVAVAQRLIG